MVKKISIIYYITEIYYTNITETTDTDNPYYRYRNENLVVSAS